MPNTRTLREKIGNLRAELKKLEDVRDAAQANVDRARERLEQAQQEYETKKGE